MSNTERYQQTEMDLSVVISKEVDGVEMGVLSDGTPVLTGRGLAKACGISNSTLLGWGQTIPERNDKLRGGKLAELLDAQGFEGDSLYKQVPFNDQPVVNAYSDKVCMAFLEYYAFEAEPTNRKEQAKNSYRQLARKSLRDYIYQMTGYDPLAKVLSSWKHFHDRLLLNPIPSGYFSVFSETAHIVLTSIRVGLIIDDHTVPDISVGQAWSKYWTANKLDEVFGHRARFPHIYPDYFPQAKANSDIKPLIYPNKALGKFREWLDTDYLPQKFPGYLKRKAKQGAISASRVRALIEAVEPPQSKVLPPD